MKWALYAIAAYLAAGTILNIIDAGKPGHPKGSQVAVIAILNAACCVVLAEAAGRLP
jgi:hypothetical protein